jgi:hypothetical protein
VNVLPTVNPFTKYKWAAIALAVVLWHMAYGAFWNRHGKLELQHEIDAERIATAQESNRMERARQSAADAAARAAATREAGILADAAGARRELGGLRGDLAAVRKHAEQSLNACTVSLAATTDVFESCADRYSGLAEEADRHASDSLKFQEAWPK